MDPVTGSKTDEALRLLKKIGWDDSDSRQAEIYANMAPARKIELMLEWRDAQVRLLKEKLRREHPEMCETELRTLFLEHLAMLREDLPK